MNSINFDHIWDDFSGMIFSDVFKMFRMTIPILIFFNWLQLINYGFNQITSSY